jgi:hypothetical protein
LSFWRARSYRAWRRWTRQPHESSIGPPAHICRKLEDEPRSHRSPALRGAISFAHFAGEGPQPVVFSSRRLPGCCLRDHAGPSRCSSRSPERPLGSEGSLYRRDIDSTGHGSRSQGGARGPFRAAPAVRGDRRVRRPESKGRVEPRCHSAGMRWRDASGARWRAHGGGNRAATGAGPRGIGHGRVESGGDGL